MKPIAISLISTLVLLGCSSPSSKPLASKLGAQQRVNRSPASDPDSTENLADAIANGQVGAMTEVAQKFVVFLDAAGAPTKIVFQNSDRFEFHADFLATLPAFKGMSREQIDAVTYKAGAGRKAILGSIIERAGDDSVMYSRLQLMMEDAPKANLVIAIYALVNKQKGDHTFPGDELNFEVLPHQIAGFSSESVAVRAAGISFWKSRDVHESVSYTNAWNVGKIVWVSSDDDVKAKTKSGEITAESILLTDANLREIPIVAGVLSSVQLTPASHLVLLGQMHGIPIVFMKRALETFKPLVGHTIYLNASHSVGAYSDTADFLLDPSPDLQARLAEFHPALKLRVDVDLNEKKIRPVQELTLKNLSAYGGKASQTGLLMKTIPANTLDVARAVPIALYKQFIATSKARSGVTLEAFIQTTLQGLGPTPTADAISVATKTIRDEIKATKIPADILTLIRTELEAAFLGTSVRLKLRSSSNAEDGAEFNGAGLYDSEGVWLKGGPMEDLENGVNKIWRSLYTERGYNARRRFRVDETKVGMGILAQKTFKGEVANGVMTYRSVAADKDRGEFDVYTYEGEEAQVTHGTGELQPEQISGFLSGDYPAFIQVIQGYNGGSKERTLMRKADYSQLGALMRKVATNYGAPTRDVAIECEFKLMPGPGSGTTVVIKQVRAIPKQKVSVAKDGSKLFYLFPRRLRLKSMGYDGTDSVAGLLMPRNVSLTVASGTEKQMRPMQVSDVTFEMSGETFTFKTPKVVGTNVAIPTKRFPSMTLKIELPKDTTRNIYSAFDSSVSYSIETAEKDWKFTVKLAQTGGDADVEDGGGSAGPRNSSYYAVHAGQAPEAWEDDSQLGDLKLTLTSVKPGLQIRVTKMKSNGMAGDSRSVRLGESEITGIIGRPIKLGANRMYYGADHHSIGETFGFDLLGDTSLTADERAKVSAGGRYLILQPIGYTGDGKGISTLRLREDGKVFKQSPMNVTEGST